jgi:arylsulfatase A-like enzyme
MQGRDLFGAPNSTEPVVSEGSYGGRQVMLLEGRWKLIRTRKSFRYTDSFSARAGTTELYDIWSDPGEEHDLARTRPEVLRKLGKRLDAWLAARGPSGDGTDVNSQVDGNTTVSRERLEALRALGYAE